MQDNNKILLMGKSGCGKTSMRSVIFANFTASETHRLGATRNSFIDQRINRFLLTITYEARLVDIEQSNYCLFENTFLHIWDCGGQDVFVQNYLEISSKQTFTSVKCLVFVMDVTSGNSQNELDFFHAVTTKLSQYSSDARIFCLLHKMDLVPECKRAQIITERCNKIKNFNQEQSANFICLGTSIWDESLYKAWSEIISSLVYNQQIVLSIQNLYAKYSSIVEVALFDVDTLLLLTFCSFTSILTADNFNHTSDPNNLIGKRRFEIISNILQQLRLSLGRSSRKEPIKSISWSNDHLSSSLTLIASKRNVYAFVVTSIGKEQQNAHQNHIHQSILDDIRKFT